MNKGKSNPKGKSDRLKPLSLYPLTPEHALFAFMQVAPKKVKTSVRKAKKKHRG
jgi:hypothetical protein